MDKTFFCIFGGGGIRGAAYTGAIKAINELNLNITGYAGSSIGAVVAGLVVFNYSPDEIQNIFDNINFEFFKDINLNFGKDFAISKGNNFYEWMKNKIEAKFYEDNKEIKEDEILPPVRFKDIEKELIIFTADLTTSKLYEFSKEKTPNAEIAHAIRISVGMPGLYAPIFSENECLADGDLLKSMPLSKASDTISVKKEKILEFRLENNETKKKILNTIEYLNAVYDTISGTASDFVIKTYKNLDKYDFIKINTENVSVADFMINKEKKHKIANIGYETTIEYFKNFYPEKCRRLSNIYKKLYNEIKVITFLIKNRELKEARFEIVSAASNLLNAVKIIDDKVVNLITEAKNIFNENYIIKKSIFGKKPVLMDNNKVLNSLKEAENYLYDKLNA